MYAEHRASLRSKWIDTRAAARMATGKGRGTDMRIYSERYCRDRRRYDLAMRLIAHEARTRTITRWTGLSLRRVRSALHSYGPVGREPCAVRHRGPPPTQATWFLRPSVCSEAAALASLCLINDALPAQRVPNAQRELPGLQYGEKLCYVYELYRKVIGNPRLSLERLMLLATLLAQGTQLQTARCARCGLLILIDPMSVTGRLCVRCRGRKSHLEAMAEVASISMAVLPLVWVGLQLELDLQRFDEEPANPPET